MSPPPSIVRAMAFNASPMPHTKPSFTASSSRHSLPREEEEEDDPAPPYMLTATQVRSIQIMADLQCDDTCNSSLAQQFRVLVQKTLPTVLRSAESARSLPRRYFLNEIPI